MGRVKLASVTGGRVSGSSDLEKHKTGLESVRATLAPRLERQRSWSIMVWRDQGRLAAIASELFNHA